MCFALEKYHCHDCLALWEILFYYPMYIIWVLKIQESSHGNNRWTFSGHKWTGRKVSGPVQKAGALFSGGTTLLSALSPLISLQLSWDKLYYKQGNSICHSPPPTTGLLNSNVFVVQEFEGSWGGNLLWISMPALMYPSLVKTNNLLFLNETESTCFAFYSHRLIRKEKNIYIYKTLYKKWVPGRKHSYKTRCIVRHWYVGGKFNHCGSQPLLGKRNVEITERWILVLEGSYCVETAAG